MEEELKISKNMLKALISETRVEILKILEKKPMTASELSKELNKHVTTISEHLDLLKKLNLVERIERPGRKWVYYKLTKDGKKILHPESYKWVAIITISFLLISSYFILNVNAYPGSIFYGIERMREKIILSLIKNETKRLEKQFEFAEERLKEIKWLVENEKGFDEILKDYESGIEDIRKRIDFENNSKILEDINEGIPKHISILRNIYIKTGNRKILEVANKSLEVYEISINKLRNTTKKPYSSLFKI